MFWQTWSFFCYSHQSLLSTSEVPSEDRLVSWSLKTAIFQLQVKFQWKGKTKCERALKSLSSHQKLYSLFKILSVFNGRCLQSRADLTIHELDLWKSNRQRWKGLGRSRHCTDRLHVKYMLRESVHRTGRWLCLYSTFVYSQHSGNSAYLPLRSRR